MQAKRYFGVFVVAILLVLSVAATIVYIVDPGRVFQYGNGKYENEIVNILLSGHNVTFKENIDWGVFQSIFISRDSISRDTIVLGSSRVMVISNAMLDILHLPKERKFLNNWVASAKLGDEIAVVMCYAERGVIPGTMILGLDPPSFDRQGVYFPSQYKRYVMGLKRIGYSSVARDEPSFWLKYYELISYPNVKATIGQILSGTVGINLTPTDKIYNEDWTNLLDGRRTFPKSYREKTAEKVESEARAFGSENGTWKMNPTQLSIFDAFIGYLLEHNVRVIIFLPPWHNIIYQKFKTDPGYRMVLESEDYIRRYAKAKNIMVIGSYDPALYNLTSSDFYDSNHLKPDAIARIFADGDIGRRR